MRKVSIRKTVLSTLGSIVFATLLIFSVIACEDEKKDEGPDLSSVNFDGEWWIEGVQADRKKLVINGRNIALYSRTSTTALWPSIADDSGTFTVDELQSDRYWLTIRMEYTHDAWIEGNYLSYSLDGWRKQ